MYIIKNYDKNLGGRDKLVTETKTKKKKKTHSYCEMTGQFAHNGGLHGSRTCA